MPAAHVKLTATIDMLASSSGDLGSEEFSSTFSKLIDLLNGTGNSQANQIVADTRTLAASTAEDLDLAGSAIKDVLGSNAAFAKVRGILVYAHTANGSTISVKPGASNGFTGPFGAAAHKVSIPAGGWFYITAPVAGWTVTAATGDLLNVANDDSGAAANYDILIIGN